jgi:hypothetical protein
MACRPPSGKGIFAVSYGFFVIQRIDTLPGDDILGYLKCERRSAFCHASRQIVPSVAAALSGLDVPAGFQSTAAVDLSCTLGLANFNADRFVRFQKLFYQNPPWAIVCPSV